MVWMNFAHLFLGLHNSYIDLSIFYDIFCHNSMTACHMMSKMMIWTIGPMAYVPTKFNWDSFKRRLKSDQPLQTNLYRPTFTTTTTTPIIIIIAKMKPHKNKIPFPFWGNGITRSTVPRGTVDPIPNELSLWPRTMFRPVTPSDSLLKEHLCMCRPMCMSVYVYVCVCVCQLDCLPE